MMVEGHEDKDTTEFLVYTPNLSVPIVQHINSAMDAVFSEEIPLKCSKRADLTDEIFQSLEQGSAKLFKLFLVLFNA